MPCPHNEISIVQRSHRQSAVAAAAYQSGEKLFCEYDQEVKHYPEKRGIVHNEILLPANAPLEYTDRNTLWNAAEAVEKQWNSQLARRWVLSIPREIPPDQYAALVRDFCRQQFVSKGMCVDFAIHDKGDGNPHAHVMLTMRAMDERGKWLPKSRKVYELDKNGERIKLPSGRWKSHKEDTVDWNDRKYGEIWRHEWEVIQNRYLEANNRPERVDLRSYERQGLDITDDSAYVARLEEINAECCQLQEETKSLLTAAGRKNGGGLSEVNRQYADYLARFEGLQKEKSELSTQISKCAAKRVQVSSFLKELQKYDGPLKEFDPLIWQATLNHAVVLKNCTITFVFRDGTEVTRKIKNGVRKYVKRKASDPDNPESAGEKA